MAVKKELLSPAGLQLLFENTPDLYLVLSPDFTIITANNAYLAATMTTREDIKGKNLFEVFPDNPLDPQAEGEHHLHASLTYVCNNREPHAMAIQKYDIRRNDGTFEERYWSPVNSPVLNEQGEISFIIHRVEDVTEFIHLSQRSAQNEGLEMVTKSKKSKIDRELFHRMRDLQKLNRDLIREVTEKKKYVAEMHKHNIVLENMITRHSSEIQDYKQALDQSSIVAITDQRGVITHVNENFCKISGFSSEELIGNQHRMIDSGFHTRSFFDDLWITISKGSIWKGEIRNKTKNGGYYWVYTTIVPFLTEREVPYQYLAISSDITARKEAEEKLINSEKIYRAIASNIPGSTILLVDTEGRYILAEGEIVSGLGYHSNDLVGKKAAETLLLDGEHINTDDLARVLSGEHFNRMGTIGERDFIIHFVPLRNGYQEVFAAMILTIDITEITKAQKQIEELNRGLEEKIAARTSQLSAVNKELEAFSYSISHDLRAPLRAINGYARMITEDYEALLDPEGKRLLKVIQDNGNRMGMLIDDLLAFSKLGQKQLYKHQVDMQELFDFCIKEIIKNLPEKPEIRTGVLHPVMGDPSLLKQVVINLVSNAIKYSSKTTHPVIEISSEQSEKTITYAIKDNGVGFDMQYYNKLFGVFQRLHSSEAFEGTGVGLAIVQRIISKHEGTVWAEGKENEGATFYFSLPA